jgi:hypothetical protein
VRAKSVLSLLSFWFFGGVLRAETTVRPRERERFKRIIKYPLWLLLLVVGLNKDEFYLEHEHHRFGVAAVFDNATS